jgi:NAD(P)-dependent dehydrogenase (short-subunit alcohol dehydrogenase family)
MGLLLAVGFQQWNKWRMKSFQIDYSSVPGNVYVVTGANSGLGYETSKELLRHGGKVIMACRDMIRGEAARAKLVQELVASHSGGERNAKIDDLDQRAIVVPLDLSSFDSIRQFPLLLDDENIFQIDGLINNAGIMALPERSVTVDGLESQIGTNHFGHFLLTMLLYPRIVNGGRIVNHSSTALTFHDAKFPFENLQSEVRYDPWTAYGNSKVANMLFTNALRRHLQKDPSKVVHTLAVHPGYASTNLQHDRFPMWELLNSISAMPAADGALSQIYAAVDARAVPVPVDHNEYIGPEFYMFGRPRSQTPSSKLCSNIEAQEHLWKESVRITKADLSF